MTAHDPEFDTLASVATELHLDVSALPRVERRTVETESGTTSVVRWGEDEPELVLLHGGGQNARTWDLVATLLGRPALALDLPGHGHSSWRSDHDYRAVTNAAAVASVIERVAASARLVVGMSLGGLTLMHLARVRSDLVPRALFVDILPRSGSARAAMPVQQRGPTALMDGDREFDSLDQMIDNAVAASPRRPREAVARGVRHNVIQLANGHWQWRYDDLRTAITTDDQQEDLLWDDLAHLGMPVTLVRGGDSAFVTDADLERFRGLLPNATVVTVPESGHSVQSDQPRALAAEIERALAD